MAKIEPVTGHYIHVPFEGEEYRIFYEESGKGIPLVCLHTASARLPSRGMPRMQGSAPRQAKKSPAGSR